LIQGIVNVKCNFLGYGCRWACNIHDWVFFLKRKFRKSCDEGQVLTLQVDGKCCLFNVIMVLLSFKDIWATKIPNTLELYMIQYKNVSGKNFWNVKRKVRVLL
jgi:hypothetical protein